MLNTILCSTDGSDHADKAVTLAIDLAERYGAKLVFMHVLMNHLNVDQLETFASQAHLKDIVEEEIERINATLMASVGPYAAVYMPAPSMEVVTRIGEVLLEDARLEANERGVDNVETVLESGDPAERILDQADKTGADMIVMGRRGLGSLAGLLAGSVSIKVDQLSECTCVTVK